MADKSSTRDSLENNGEITVDTKGSSISAPPLLQDSASCHPPEEELPHYNGQLDEEEKGGSR